MTRRRHLLAMTVLAAAALVGRADAQGYPNGTVTMVVPYAAGGPTDTVARLVAEPMGRALGEEVIVENVAGAGGTLGAARVGRAAPDGQTLLLHHIGLATSKALYRELPFDPGTAFAPIGLVTEAPMTLIARPDLEPTTIQELLDHIRTHKDRITYGNAGLGGGSHVCGMLIMDALDTAMTTVPYKGTGPALTDLMGSQIDLMCDQATNTVSPIKAGRVKAYAVTTAERVSALPDLPTLAEAGLGGAQVSVWHGLYAPKGTPSEAVERLAEALRAALADPNVKRRFADLATKPAAAEDVTPDALSQRLTSEIARWTPIILAAGVYAN